MQSDHSYSLKEVSLIQAVATWLSPVVAEPQALVCYDPSLLLAWIPKIHLPLGEDRAQAMPITMEIKAIRTKAVAVFMLALLS